MEIDWDRVRRVYEEALKVLVDECGIAIGDDECAKPDVREWLEGMAKIASTVIVALDVKDWYPKWGGVLVGFRWVDQIWWLSYGPVAGGWEGPPSTASGDHFTTSRITR